MRDLAGRSAVVTGAASGIGKSLARRLAAEGMSVVLADVERRALDEAAAEIGGDVGTVIPVVTDVSDATSVDALAEPRLRGVRRGARALQQRRRVPGRSDCGSAPRADFEWTLGVNLWGILHASQSFVPRMLEQGEDAPHREHGVDGRSRDDGVLRALRGVEVRGRRRHRVPGPRPRLAGRADQGVVAVPGKCRHRDRPLTPQPSRAVRGRADRRARRSWRRRWRAPPRPARIPTRSPRWCSKRSTTRRSSSPPPELPSPDPRSRGSARGTEPPAVGQLRLAARRQQSRRRASRGTRSMPSCASAFAALAAITRLRAFVRGFLVDVDLVVEHPLPEADDPRAEAQDLRDQRVDRGVELSGRDDVVHQTPVERGAARRPAGR